MLIVSWVHGCIGLYFWLRMKAFYKTRRAVPARRRGADSDAGDARPLSGRTQRDRRQRQRRMAAGQSVASARCGTRPKQHVLEDITDYFLIGYLGLLGLVVAGAEARAR